MMRLTCLLFAMICLLTVYGYTNGQAVKSYYSTVTSSKSGTYAFAQLSTGNLHNYATDTISGWKRAGYSRDELKDSEKSLRLDIENERQLRAKFRVSGLFEVNNSSARLVGVVNEFPVEMDSIFVSDKGDFIVGFNPSVIEPRIKPNDSINSLLQTDELAFVSLFFLGGETKRCLIKVNSLLSEKDKILINSEGFYWASEKGQFDEASKELIIEKLDGDKITFAFKDCLIKNDKENESTTIKPSISQNGKSMCGSAALVVGLLLAMILGRYI